MKKNKKIIKSHKVKDKISHLDTSYTDESYHSPIMVWVFLVFSFVLGVWIMQQSINAYYLQTYHRPSPLSKMHSPIWKLGANIGNKMSVCYDTLTESINHINQSFVVSFNENYAYTPQYQAFLAEKKQQEAARLAKELAVKQQQLVADKRQAIIAKSLTVNKSQKVFFVGDSMMQGIAPHMQKYLQSVGIDSINLSKQSTGLAYPSFFDWPQTIKNTILNNADIKVLIVMLGPNDPWDMPKKGGGKYLSFGTQEWREEYQSRMAEIINFAKKHQVGVIWVTPPHMKKDKLNAQMMALNEIMAEELARHDVQMIDSRPIMGGVATHYRDYLKKEGKQIKMRSSDGIHFSVEGQKILAKEVQSYLIIQ